MAAIDEVDFSTVKGLENFKTLDPGIKDEIREAVGAIFWYWYEKHYDMKLFTVNLFWFLKKAVYVRDLYSLFELLFGSEPSTAIQKP